MAGEADWASLLLSCQTVPQERIESLQDDMPWLEYRHDTGDMFCRPCMESGLECHFSMNDGRDIFKEHGASTQHLAACGLRIIAEQTISVTSTIPSQDLEEDSSDDTDTEEADPSEHIGEAGKLDGDTDDVMRRVATEVASPQSEESTNHQEGEEGEEEEEGEEQEEEQEASTHQSSKDKRVRRFCVHWLIRFSWLQYDKPRNVMFCKLCVKHAQNSALGSSYNSYIKGNHCFKLESLSAHAGSVDHQMAEKAEKLYNSDPIKQSGSDCQITAKQKFILKKYLILYPWLMYRSDVQMIICELCQRHTSNQLFLDAKGDIDQEAIQRHRCSKLHLVAEETEAKSWAIMWDTLTAHSVSTEVVTRDEDPRKDVDRRSAALFRDTSVRVTGTDTELEISNSDVSHHDMRELSTSAPDGMLVNGVIHPKARARGYFPHPRKRPVFLPAFGAFQRKWLEEFKWLNFDSQSNVMTCILCQKHKKKIGFARGVRCFSRSYIVSHARMKKHQEAAKAEGIQVPHTGGRKKHSPQKSSEQTPNNLDWSQSHDDAIMDVESSPNTRELPDQHHLHENNTPDKGYSPMPSDVQVKQEILDGAEHSNTDVNQSDTSIYINSPLQQTKTKKGSPQKRVRCFYPNWEIQFPWIQYNKVEHTMTCAWCVQQNFNSSFTRGSRCFHIDSLRAHDGSVAHQKAACAQLEPMLTF